MLGGGLSGLLAAWHLRRRGLDATVWEAGDTVGGWAQTLPWPGPHGEPGWLERGPQALRVGRGSALDHLLRDLGLPLRPPGPRGPRWLGLGDGRHPSPTTLAGLLRAPGLGLGGRLRLLAEPFIPPGTDADETLHAFMERRLGAEFAHAWLPALVAGVLAAPPERLGLDGLPRLRRQEARGGLLLGGLRLGPERTRLPEGGTGALAAALAAGLPVSTQRLALGLEPRPGGDWRVQGEDAFLDVEAVVVALPSHRAAPLLQAVAPQAAAGLAAIPRLDLRVWHSRHPLVPGWERGLGLLVHPPDGQGLLGAVSLAADDPRGVPGLLQLRTYLGGAYPVDPGLDPWPGVFQALRRWLPELPEAVQVRAEPCPGAFPLLEPGHGARREALLAALPPGLHWVGADRFGPGIADLAEGLAGWAQDLGPMALTSG